MEYLLSGQMPFPSFTKNFKVDYFRIGEDLWRGKVHVKDPIYNIIVTLDMSVPDFIIRDSAVHFLNYPRQECMKAASKIKKLNGADGSRQFREILQREYLGPKGCDTIFNMVNICGRAFVILYLAYERGLGGIKAEQYRKFFAETINCVAGQVERVDPDLFAPMHCVPALKAPEVGPEPSSPGDFNENEPVLERMITVDYFELSDNLWRTRSHLDDNQHNIFVTLDVSTADLVVRDANITFFRQPWKECDLMLPRMKKIVGVCLATDYRQRVRESFVGMEGCGVAYSMLNTMHRGFLQFYLWRNSVLGRISPEQQALCREGLKQDCIACSL